MENKELIKKLDELGERIKSQHPGVAAILFATAAFIKTDRIDELAKVVHKKSRELLDEINGKMN